VAAEADVELTVPPGHHPVRVPGLRVRRSRLPDGSLCRRCGVAVTTPEATAVRVAAALAGDDAVVAVDRLVAKGVADLGSVRSLAAAARGPGSARARDACRLADGLAESPQENRVRLLVHRGGLPAPVAQFVVRDAQGFVARVDLAWAAHRSRWSTTDSGTPSRVGSHVTDSGSDRLQAAGWRVVFVTAADLHRPDELVARIAAALTPVR
jgi:hypothetical protein